MSDINGLDRGVLRRVAMAASQGDWMVSGAVVASNVNHKAKTWVPVARTWEPNGLNNADYIAHASPQTMLFMLDMIERLEAELSK